MVLERQAERLPAEQRLDLLAQLDSQIRVLRVETSKQLRQA